MKNLVVLILLLCSNWAVSQVTFGKIQDEFNAPVEYAYITNLQSKMHAHTDELGKFAIERTKPNDTLQVTALGFKKTLYVVTDQAIRIILPAAVYELDQVVVEPKVTALNVISKIDLATNPVNSSQEILRKVPGLFIGQHAGGGKAEQIFLRGFDIDHGTDIAISVDGMPVNMVSHAHGQGYADLHFLIPETVDKIDFGKGTYYADQGDFATAGYVSFKTKENVTQNAIGVEVGQFNTLRTVGLFNLLENNPTEKLFFATEYILTDGPFEAPQDFKRVNLFAKYTKRFTDNSKFSLTVSRFESKWNASGQIPQRLVDNGTITRFGAVDSTEGGFTSRNNLIATFIKPLSETSFVKATAFYTNYDFLLYSNFTFFLENPIDGDQIRQKETRSMYGSSFEFNQKYDNAKYQVGVGFRSDATTDSELSSTKNRFTTLESFKLGDIDQNNAFAYVNAEFTFNKWMINPAVRLDYFKFNYNDQLVVPFQSLTADKYKVSPKLNVFYNTSKNVQFFVKSGLGFHSNDTRVAVSQMGKEILPTAFGTDIGTIFKPFPRLIVNAAVWQLFLEQEFVYVGDAGIVEPSGRSQRMGVEFGARYQLTDYVFFDSDVNYTYARSIDEPSGQDYIPLAPDFTTTGGLSIANYKGFSGGIRYRYLNHRPANEDNSIVAEGYFVTDMNVNYTYKKMNFGIAIENLFNTAWNETQFATESRLQNESQSVEEIHFTPGTPFFIKAKIAFTF
jgi:hypothetical protein